MNKKLNNKYFDNLFFIIFLVYFLKIIEFTH